MRWLPLTLATSDWEGTCREIPSSMTHKLPEPCFLTAFCGWWFVGKCLTPFKGRRKEERETKCWKSDLWCLLASSVEIFMPWKTSRHQCSLAEQQGRNVHHHFYHVRRTHGSNVKAQVVGPFNGDFLLLNPMGIFMCGVWPYCLLNNQGHMMLYTEISARHAACLMWLDPYHNSRAFVLSLVPLPGRRNEVLERLSCLQTYTEKITEPGLGPRHSRIQVLSF